MFVSREINEAEALALKIGRQEAMMSKYKRYTMIMVSLVLIFTIASFVLPIISNSLAAPASIQATEDTALTQSAPDAIEADAQAEADTGAARSGQKTLLNAANTCKILLFVCAVPMVFFLIKYNMARMEAERLKFRQSRLSN